MKVYIPLRFVVTGWAAYILVSYQGSHQSLCTINLLTHFTQRGNRLRCLK